MRTVIIYFGVIIALSLGIALPLSAQQTENNSKSETHTFIYRGEPIAYALQQLVQQTDLDLIYDPAILPDHAVFVTAKQKSPEDILRLILKDSGLDFIQLSSGTYVLTTAPGDRNLKGNLTGKVTDRRTGEPLVGANVMLADASGGTATSPTGVFKIPQLEKGYHEVTINYVGYRPVKDTVWIPANSTTSLNFSMTAEPVLVEPIVVKGIQKRIPASRSFTSELSATQISRRQSLGAADALKSMDAISGIDFSLPLADFSIQGGGSGDHQLRLDGVPIYNPVSMGRMIGAFSPWSIKKIEINKAGFSAPVGSQLAGIVNIVQDVSHAPGSQFLLQANSTDINGRFDHHLDFDDGPSINLMLAARTNIWQLYQEPNLKQMFQNWDRLDPLLTLHLFQRDSSNTIFKARDHSYDITYYDLHAAAQIEHTPFHQTRISAYHGKNRLKTNLFSKNVALTTQPTDLYYSIDDYDWSNSMVKVEHQWLVNARLDANLSGYITSHSFDHHYFLTNNQRANIFPFTYTSTARQELQEFAAQAMETGDRNAMVQSSAKMSLNYSATKDYTLSGGLSVTHLDYRFSLSDQYYNQARSDADSFLIAGYIQNDFLLSPKTSLSAGSRLTFIPSRDLVFAEPRLSFKYEEPNTSIGYLSAKLSGGIYRQFINQFDVSNVGPSSLVPSLRFWVPVDYTTDVPKAYHLALDGLWEPSQNWKFQIESYYKWIPSRLTLNYHKLSAFPMLNRTSAFSKQQEFINTTRGYAYGAGLSIQRTIPSLNMELKGSYQSSIARQIYPSRFGKGYQPLPSSQPHQLDASVNWKVVTNLTFLLQWQGVWGRSWGFRKAYYDYLSIREARTYDAYSFNDPGNDTLPRYSQLNTSLSYRFSIGASNLQLRMDVFNLLDNQNVINRWLSPYKDETGDISYELRERTMPGLRPSLSIKLSY
ncbi:TonB-dependent receptor [Fodinibius salsisoli]|uniref:TonB-dependent receptor n=1 Tax=Fodinibius salsisoli TaxID=2820877 RepID=A0ABT3PN08_9BACT|nr:TonB-dependent receptor [Fodinibius salsisoli]MCW9707346.1 TonB-dependent receptor [Fodinibius salsisoli]